MHDYIWQMIHHHYFFNPWHSAYSETQKILALALKTAHSTSIYVGVRCHKNVYIYIFILYIYIYILYLQYKAPCGWHTIYIQQIVLE